MTNPFANDPWGDTLIPANDTYDVPDDGAPANDAPVIPINNTATTEKKETAISNSAPGSDKIVVTLKGGAGYDAPWIVFHGGTVQEVNATIQEAFSAGLHETVRKASQAFAPAQASPAFRGAAQATPQTPVQAQGDDKTCPHGQRVHRTGTSARGPWSAWFCPAGKDSGCSPIWGK